MNLQPPSRLQHPLSQMLAGFVAREVYDGQFQVLAHVGPCRGVQPHHIAHHLNRPTITGGTRSLDASLNAGTP